MSDTDGDVRLNSALIALENAEGRIDEVQNEEELERGIQLLDATPNDELRELIEEMQSVRERLLDQGAYEAVSQLDQFRGQLEEMIKR